MTEQEEKRQTLDAKKMSALDIFASQQETFEEAKKKSSDESSKRASYLRLSQDGTYNIRILPLAPVVNADGEVLPLERKGYEYPLRTLMLKIVDTTKQTNGKPKIVYVSVCNAKHTFKERLESDLIDTYVKRACELYADDKKLCEQLRSGSFSGGLRFDSKRCMYVINLDEPAGIQILQLSYSQYRDLEERKLATWNKLLKKNPHHPCPISSISNAYLLEITRKTESKTSYSFNIDTLSGVQPLDEDTLQTLLDTPRLPEVLYRYTRYHLEATIFYLKQLDEKYDIDVVNDAEVQQCIEQIKSLLPADDQSHFDLNRTDSGKEETTAANDLDSLWDRYDKLTDQNLDDKSAEGQELRGAIREYIENHDLDIRISHKQSNADLLNEIEDLMNAAKKDEADAEEKEEAPAERPAATHNRRETEPEPEDEPDDAEPAEPQDEAEDEESAEPVRRSRERNDDTNEPAVRIERRSGRPQRRR